MSFNGCIPIVKSNKNKLNEMNNFSDLLMSKSNVIQRFFKFIYLQNLSSL
jgi:hypothetical protein